MNYSPIHAIVNRVHNFASHCHAANGHKTTRQGFRHTNHVRLNIPVLNCPKFTSAPKTSLHFIRNKQSTIFFTEALNSRQVVIIRQINAFTLYGLDDKRRHIITA